MRAEEIKENTMLMWFEYDVSYGPCFMEDGFWYWSNDFNKMKNFILNEFINTALGFYLECDEEDNINLTFDEFINKYEDDIFNEYDDIIFNKLKNIVVKEVNDITTLTRRLNQIVKILNQLDISIRATLFKDSISAKKLLDKHLGTRLNKLDYYQYFIDDNLEDIVNDEW